MTTAVHPAPLRAAATADAGIAPVPFGRLLHVELRKTVDTRSGRWLLAAIGLITVGVIAVYLFNADPESLTFRNFVGVTSTPQSLLLPVLAILTVTTEWTQRTALVTFTVEPSRIRVVLAKLLAVLALGLLAVVVAVTVAALGNVAGAAFLDGAGSWNLEAANARDLVVMQLVAVLQGFAFGMLLMSTPAAIVAYYVLPLLWSAAFALVGALEDAAPWLDLNSAIAPLYSGNSLSGDDWAHVAVAGTLWVLLPLALGVVRLLRREVKSS
jgi:ABC-type transport system involved in multi-copper enzyme maturation permease subunit